MQTIFARQACLPNGWVQDLRLEIAGGVISTITPGAAPQNGDTRVDTLLPGIANLHSHSFQRAMAGMTEHSAPGKDSFWTWRDLMYRFVERLAPDHIQAIAALTFMEMLEAGFTSVGEFHYIHHQPGGAPYADPAELSQRIFAAASETGLGLTHLPVLYSYGGAGQQPLSGGQLRFGNSLDGFAALLDGVRTSARRDMPADTVVGLAPHSLRATCPVELLSAIALQEGAPLHIHIAEQPAEVRDISDWLGATPVAWLLENAPVNDSWCLIHATHMTEAETHDLTKTGAVAGLCPITEANLGDGPFNGPGFLSNDGHFGIGSDSNVRISLPEELRTLEYSQRLRDLARNVMVKEVGSVGNSLYLGAAKGGAQALGRGSGLIEVGALADLMAIDSGLPGLCALAQEQLLDGFCFAAGDDAVTDVCSAGRHQLRQGQHIARDAIIAVYRKTMRDLCASL